MLTIQTGLDEARRKNNPALASQAVRAFARQRFFGGAKEAIKVLANMGDGAPPMLNHLFSDSTLSHLYPDIIAAMVTAGGNELALILTEIVEHDYFSWRHQSSKLDEGWWNDSSGDHRRWLREQYAKLLAALRALRPLQYEPCRTSIVNTLELWQRIPALGKSGNGQIIHECERILRGLDTAISDPEPD